MTISGGTVGEVIGGYSEYGNATDNNVTISGGTVKGDIYGGSTSGIGDFSKNTVTISGTPDISECNIYGGWSDILGYYGSNTLNVYTGGHTVKSVQGFLEVHFHVPEDMGKGGVMLTATDSVDLIKADVDVAFEGACTALSVGDHIVLIDVLTPGGLTAPHLHPSGGTLGVTLSYDIDILIPDSNRDQLWAVLKNLQVNPQAEVFADGYLTGSMLLNQTGDRIAGGLLNSAVNAACQNRNSCWGVFADISGHWGSYNAGTNVDWNGHSVVAGASRRFGRFTGGLFFEHGNGSSKAFHIFDNAAPVRSKGNLEHNGGGVLGRFEFGNCCGASRFYLDGSFRAGGLHNKFGSDLRDRHGAAAGFNTDATYYGFHFGGGKIRQFNNASLDVYGKYLGSHTGGNAIKLTTGDSFVFQGVDSHRLRLGGRYVFAACCNSNCPTLSPYVGAAWEHEWDGTARAAACGRFAVDAPTLRGGTGIGEFGVALQPACQRGFFADLGVQGYTGKRDGFGVTLYVGRNF